MGLYRKFKFLRLAFQSILVLNIFLVAWGLVALSKYLEVYETNTLELMFVGTLTLVVGFLVPAYLLNLVTKQMREIKEQAEQKIAGLVGVWLQSMEKHDGDVYSNPLFWMNIALGTAETLVKDSSHPAGAFFYELSPMIRNEIRKHLETSTTRKSRSP